MAVLTFKNTKRRCAHFITLLPAEWNYSGNSCSKYMHFISWFYSYWTLYTGRGHAEFNVAVRIYI